MGTLQIGDRIPKFILKDQDGRNLDIRDYIGKKKLIIYFYPKDQSAVCTKEACSFRDSFADFTDSDVMVIGINSASVKSHKEFAVKERLPFTLLSDPKNIVLKQFGVKSLLFLTGRETFVVGLDGKIVYSFRAFLDGSAHPEKVLSFLDNSGYNAI